MTMKMRNKTILKIISFSLFLLTSTPTFALQVLALGDSITQGYQRNSSGVIYAFPYPLNGLANTGGYLPRLNGLLDSRYGASTVYNWGIGGERSDGGLFRINSVINTRPNADYILIMYGANDLYAGISSSATRANINAMIDISRSRGVEPIISEITPNTRFGNAIPGDYNVKIRNLASSKNVYMARNYQIIASGWLSVPYHSGDTLHLNNAAYYRMANEWFYRIRDHQNYLAEQERLRMEQERLRKIRSSIPPIITILLLDD